MSTRLRLVLQLQGETRHGGNARKNLEQWYAYHIGKIPKKGTLPEQERLVKMFQEVLKAGQSANLWMFREPRRIRVGRSRFKLLCRYLRIGRRIRRERDEIDIEDLVAPVIRARIAASRIATSPMPSLTVGQIRQQLTREESFRWGIGMPSQAPIQVPMGAVVTGTSWSPQGPPPTASMFNSGIVYQQIQERLTPNVPVTSDPIGISDRDWTDPLESL